MHFAIQTFDFFINTAHLVRSKHSLGRKIYLASTYLFLGIIALISRFIPVQNISFLGFHAAGTFENCYYLFGEIFIKNEYYFETDKKAPVILDCGSNVGMSIIYFKFLYPESTIYGFEPDPTTFALLKRTIEKNNFSKVHVYNEAVADRKGTIDFYTEPTPGSLIGSALRGTVSDKTTVRACDLADFVRGKKIDFMKMDIEGYESRVVRHLAKKNYLNTIQEMIIEYHHNIPGNRISWGEFIETIERAGFKYQIDTRNIPIYQKNKFQDIIIFAYKNK